MKRKSLFITGYILNWILFLGFCFLYFKLSKGLLFLIINFVILVIYSYIYFIWKLRTKKEIVEFYKENEEFFKRHEIDSENMKMYDFLIKMLDISNINSQYSNEDKIKANKIIDFIRETRPEFIDVIKK